MSRRALVLFGVLLLTGEGCATAPPSLQRRNVGTQEGVYSPRKQQPLLGQRSVRRQIFDRSGSGESDLDVWITFTGKAWEAVRTDPDWATDVVIARLRRYKSKPEAYFATQPAWATRWLPWRSRIKFEIGCHRLIGDNDIHFSEWWISRDRWTLTSITPQATSRPVKE